MYVHQRFHLQGKVLFGAPFSHRNVPPPLTRAEGDEQIGRAFASVVIVIAATLSRQSRKGLTNFTHQLQRTLVETDDGEVRVVGFGVQVEDVLHAGDKLPIYFRNAPLRLLPGL